MLGLVPELQELENRAKKAEQATNQALSAMDQAIGDLEKVKEQNRESKENIATLRAEITKLRAVPPVQPLALDRYTNALAEIQRWPSAALRLDEKHRSLIDVLSQQPQGDRLTRRYDELRAAILGSTLVERPVGLGLLMDKAPHFICTAGHPT